MGTGFLERARPADVALLVEPRGHFDQHGHLLVQFGGSLQRGDDRRPGAHAIQRLLDRQDVGIVGRLRQQGHHWIVGLVGMLQQQVALVQHREDVGLLRVGEHVDRLHLGIPQPLEPRQLDEAHHHPQIQRSRDDVDVVSAEFELIAQQCDQFIRRVRADLETHDVASSSASQLAFDDLDVGATAFVVQFQLGITRQTHDRRFENRLAREEAWQVRRDDVLEQDETQRLGVGELYQPRQNLRHLDDCEPRRLAWRSVQPQCQVEAER